MPVQHILAVEFHSPDGRTWNAVGGGATVAEAILYARGSCPAGPIWNVFSWDELYGD